MIPSGYKASKLYSAKPTDGTGDLTFTRTGSTATRVNESGIIEKCRTNLVLNSATLVTQNVTVVAAPYTLSIFGTGSVVLTGTGSGTLTGTGAANRVSLTFTPTAGTLTLTVAGSVTSAQLEIGDIATAYIPTTAAAVTVGPIANLPRLDYTGGGCPKLLMEPTRTNLLTYSEQFNNVIWDKTGTTITSNATTSPDGYTNADKIVATSATGTKFTFQLLNSTIGLAYTGSAFFKASEYNYVFLRLGGIGGNLYVIYNLSTQAVVSTSGMTSTSITSFGNGWYRITATATATGANIAPVFMVIPSTGYTLNAQNIPEFTGDNVSGGFIWGAQVEVGSFATSYIPTNNATVTRNIDSAIKTSATALIGQTEGTIYSEINVSTLPGILNRDIIFLSDGTTNNTVHIGFSHTLSNTITARVVVSGSPLATIDSAVLSATGTYKVAMAYKLNDIVFYINGVQIGVDTSATIPTCSQLNIGSNLTPAAPLSDGIKSSIVFKTRLSNVDLATLTTI
jgi:hypothetical protein